MKTRISHRDLIANAYATENIDDLKTIADRVRSAAKKCFRIHTERGSLNWPLRERFYNLQIASDLVDSILEFRAEQQS